MSVFLVFGLAYLAQTLYCLATFVVAEALDARVRRLQVGLGPTISDFTLGHTRLVLKVLPFMASVNADGLGWYDQSPWKRVVVFAAGPLSLVVLGCLILGLSAHLYGTPVALNSTEVGGVGPESPAAEAGVATGDLILSIQKVEVSKWSDVRRAFRQAGAESVGVSFSRDGVAGAATIAPSDERERRGFMSLLASAPTAGMEERIERVQSDLPGSISAGFRAGGLLTITYVSAIRQMTTGLLDSESLDAMRVPGSDSGQWGTAPAGLVWNGVQRTRGEASLWAYASFTILFGIFNLLPVPGLNGGSILLVVMEAFKGEPLGDRAEARLRTMGFVALCVLMARLLYFEMVGQ